MTPLINYIIHERALDYVAATSEGEAIGIAAGAYLAGRNTLVMCQNSGLGNMVNPLASLNFTFRIPTLLIITLRGEPGIQDEPQHELMGQIAGNMLDLLRISWAFFPETTKVVKTALKQAEEKMIGTGLPFAFIMKKGAIEKNEHMASPSRESSTTSQVTPQGQFNCPVDTRMSRRDAIKIIHELISDEDAVVATTGKIGRELYSLKDSNNHLYVVGSMGCASGIGFGIQYVKSHQRVFVLDGDGAALMKMGTMATIGHYKPAGLVHVIFDNEAHESTGGQPTVSTSVDFCKVASACGYNACYRVDNKTDLKNAIASGREIRGPSLIHVKVACVSSHNLGRPTIKPVQVKERFMRFLQSTG